MLKLKLNKREAKCLLDNLPTLGLDQDRSSELTEQESDELIEKLYQFTVKEETPITLWSRSYNSFSKSSPNFMPSMSQATSSLYLT